MYSSVLLTTGPCIEFQVDTRRDRERNLRWKDFGRWREDSLEAVARSSEQEVWAKKSLKSPLLRQVNFQVPCLK